MERNKYVTVRLPERFIDLVEDTVKQSGGIFSSKADLIKQGTLRYIEELKQKHQQLLNTSIQTYPANKGPIVYRKPCTPTNSKKTDKNPEIEIIITDPTIELIDHTIIFDLTPQERGFPRPHDHQTFLHSVINHLDDKDNTKSLC